MIDQRVDARPVQTERLHFVDNVVLQVLVVPLLRRREQQPFKLGLEVPSLQTAQPLVGTGDGIEKLHHLGFKLGLNCGNRKPILLLVLVIEVALADRPVAGLLVGGVFLGRLNWRGERNGRCGHLERPSGYTQGRFANDQCAIGTNHRGRHGL